MGRCAIDFAQDFEPICMLLSVGSPPPMKISYLTWGEKLKAQIQKWIDGLKQTKICLKSKLDNEELEKEILEFVFTEDYLLETLSEILYYEEIVNTPALTMSTHNPGSPDYLPTPPDFQG